MLFKVTGALDIPESIASLILGTHLDPTMGAFNDFVITLDEDGTKRLSAILTLLYTDRDRAINNSAQDPVPMSQPIVQPQIVSKPKQMVRKTTSMPEKSDPSVSQLKKKMRKLMGGV